VEESETMRSPKPITTSEHPSVKSEPAPAISCKNHELMAALNSPEYERTFNEVATRETCPIGLDPIHCPSCHFNPTGVKCEYYLLTRRAR